MPRPVHFEIPAEQPERAMRFYETIFGWRFQKWDGPMEYWMIETGNPAEPGINGGLMQRLNPGQPCVNTVAVESIDATLTAVTKAGGLCVVPKMPVPGVGWLAYCKDTESHIFGIMQADPAAQ